MRLHAESGDFQLGVILSRYTNLTTLQLPPDGKWTAAGVAGLASSPKIQELSVTAACPEVLNSLAGLSQLVCLHLAGVTADVSGFPWDSLTLLKRLSLRIPLEAPPKIALDSLSNMTQLQYLHVRNAGLPGPHGLQALTGLTRLNYSMGHDCKH